MRYFGGRRDTEPAMAGAAAGGARPSGWAFERPDLDGDRRHDIADAPTAGAAEPAGVTEITGSDEIGITEDDLDSFERLLAEIQAAFAREDYAGLRERCTPEIVSFLSEELSQNAVSGVRNDVSAVRLLQGDVAGAWREGDLEYATVAMRYESVDVMRDRETRRIVSGEATPAETTEIWTFVRPFGGDWKLSAIQDA
jgi:predicted lipid-binding transport protein (Tim44 family)